MAIAREIAISGLINISKRVRWAVVEMRIGLSGGSCLSVVVVVVVEDGFKLAWSRLLTLLLPIVDVFIQRRKSKEESGKKGKVLCRQQQE
jgi:hypothetical protein